MNDEAIIYEDDKFTIVAAAHHPNRACGSDFTWTPDGITDEAGHAVGYVHLRPYLAATAVVGIVHAIHQPTDGWCDVCGTASPCATLRVTTAAMEVHP